MNNIHFYMGVSPTDFKGVRECSGTRGQLFICLDRERINTLVHKEKQSIL